MPQEPLSQHPGGPQPPVGYEQPASQPPFEQAPQPAAAATVYWKEPRKSRGWIVALVAIISVCLVSVFGIVSCTSAIAFAIYGGIFCITNKIIIFFIR